MNCEEMEHLMKKVLQIKVVGYRQTNSGVPSAVTLDNLLRGAFRVRKMGINDRQFIAPLIFTYFHHVRQVLCPVSMSTL
jgi:hypothetical protein